VTIGVAGSAFQEDVLFAFGGGDPGVTIAVLDGPVDRTHDCFRGARLTPLEVKPQSRAVDGVATAHGTHAASVIFGQPCSSVEGVAPLCRGLIVPIFGLDRPSCNLRDLAYAIQLAVDHGAHIICISGSRFIEFDEANPVLAEALERCVRDNVLIVLAGGDLSDEIHRTPARGAALAIGASDEAGRPLGITRHRNGIPGPGLLVPGSRVIGAALEGGVGYRTGAAFATALASGIAGLLLSTQLGNGFPLDPRAVRTALLKGTMPAIAERDVGQQRLLGGRVQIQRSIDRLLRRDGVGGASPSFPNGLTASGLDGCG
jgi:subtilisin family serine protease